MPPTVDLEGTLPPKTQWSDMEGFFPDRPGLPLGTPGLTLGMEIELARTRLEGMSLGRVVSRDIDGKVVHTATLEKPPDVAVAIISDTAQQTVEELQYTVPANQAERTLVDTWGIPAGFTLEEEPSYLWADDQLRIEWVTVSGKSTGLLMYTLPDAAEAPASAP